MEGSRGNRLPELMVATAASVDLNDEITHAQLVRAKLIEERKKGNVAYLKYDKLIVKDNKSSQEKRRRRELSTSPYIHNNQPKKQQVVSSIKSNRPSAFALNILTLKNEENLVELIYALEDIKWDIVGLSEVRRMGENIISYPDYMFYHIGETPDLYGVGFIVKKHITKYVEGFVATSYYKKLYENKKTKEEIDLANTISIPSILEAEVEKAIDTQSIDKTPGLDGINNEILKQGKEILIPVLTDMYNDVRDTEIIPQQWTKSNIILLYKKGDKHEIGNYRRICLMSNVYKVFAKIILKRIERTLDEQQPIEQAGFRKNYSVIDYIHTVRQIIEKYNEYQFTYYITFINHCKAFDSLLHKNLWETLVEQGVEYKYIRLIRNVYNHSTARIQLERKAYHLKWGKELDKETRYL
ncbi:LINE-1 reverse transcriptase homolog [Eumeta japonica]|uniref:LINE-1 reverse transcriptase homolog n=1 Tax=Eumeta variegata TaxID=151549 RepID=A0A4C2A595_EUMVA|nr:LINE-1 reverse transcriptase homolog [Eumeta japonica]